MDCMVPLMVLLQVNDYIQISVIIIDTGKKLVGKPFITDRSHIYCGDQVNENSSHVMYYINYNMKLCSVLV